MRARVGVGAAHTRRLGLRVARELSRDGRIRAPEFEGDGTERQIVLKPDLYQGALFQAQLFVGFGHATDSPARVLHLDFERAQLNAGLSGNVP